MTPLVRFFRREWQRWIGTWEEGPRPPQRLTDIVADFAARNPRATRGEWARFAARHAGESYRTGYERGLQHGERDPRGLDPNGAADLFDPDWRWASPPVDLLAEDDVVLDAGAASARRAEEDGEHGPVRRRMG